MSHDVRIIDDLKTAAILAGCAGLFGAATVPVLLPTVFEHFPPEQRTLPLPLPLFCVVLVIQFLIIYGLLALAGLRLARTRNREPAPLLTSFWSRGPGDWSAGRASLAFGSGVLCGGILVAAIAIIKRTLPHTLPGMLHPPSFWGALLASATASFGEEILCRLFLLSALLRILPVSRKNTVVAVVIDSLLFGALHAPAAAFLFGGLENIPSLSWVWIGVLNAIVGITCAVWYVRIGIGGAILAHFGADLVWHVVAQLFQ